MLSLHIKNPSKDCPKSLLNCFMELRSLKGSATSSSISVSSPLELPVSSSSSHSMSSSVPSTLFEIPTYREDWVLVVVIVVFIRHYSALNKENDGVRRIAHAKDFARAVVQN